MVEDCLATVDIYNDGSACPNLLESKDFSIAELYSMNPSVGADCSGLWLGKLLVADHALRAIRGIWKTRLTSTPMLPILHSMWNDV